MGIKKDLLNKRFGRLLVIRELEYRDKYRNVLWECLCDCGNTTILAGNTLLNGLVISCGCYKLERVKDKRNEKNPMWKGNKVKKGALHRWIEVRKPKPELCERCKKVPPLDLSNISGEYFRDINDFEWLCRSCHMKYDGRLKYNKNRWEITACLQK